MKKRATKRRWFIKEYWCVVLWPDNPWLNLNCDGAGSGVRVFNTRRAAEAFVNSTVFTVGADPTVHRCRIEVYR